MRSHLKKQLLLGVSCAALAAATPAHAAPPVPVYNWTGWYAGGNIGYSWGRAENNYSEPGFSCCGLPTPNEQSAQLNGLIGGGQIGYNWEPNPYTVVGFETDFQGSGEKGSSSASSPYGFDCFDGFCLFSGTVSNTVSSSILWFGTMRARVGVLIDPTLLLYGTGGLAYGRISTSGTITDTGCTPTCSWSYGNSTLQVGWTTGVGIEGLIPNTTNWTWKLEALYVNFGTISGTGYDSDFASPYSWSTKVTDSILRVGINYQFH
jgi:outer membrane immunogenic protein